MNSIFFKDLEKALASERLDAYRHDGVDELTTLARYLLNMSLCEALYSPLQMAEVTLRNAVHNHLSDRFKSEAWYDVIPSGKLLPWQSKQLIDAKDSLTKENKDHSPGRIVAELHFGFWTGFFNRQHARTGIGFSIADAVFCHAPKSERNLNILDGYWTRIRQLRNRVFHHERILHWSNLDAQHNDLLKIIGWISPEMRELAEALDHYTPTRQSGLTPWIEKIRTHWSKA